MPDVEAAAGGGGDDYHDYDDARFTPPAEFIGAAGY